MSISIRTTRLFKIIAGSILGWIVAVLLTGLVVKPEGEPAQIEASLIFGLVAGLLSVWFDLRIVPKYLRRLTAGWLLCVRTVFYAVMVALAVLLMAGLIGAHQEGRPTLEIFQSEAYRDFVISGHFLAIIILLTGASFLINFVRQVSRMLGPGVLTRLFLGRYVHPVEEERLFMFLDLTNSTAIAEQLGPLQFNAFKNDFFYDVAEPILATRGEIYQYVGDEVVVTWKVRNEKPVGNGIDCFFLIDKQIQSHRERYLRRYGIVPAFKAGFHGGTVVTAQVGDIKRDIVHSGDTVNTAARIEAQCRPLDRRVLISDRVLTWYETSKGLKVEDLGPMRLRGKTDQIHLFGVERSPSAPLT